jgi:tripartite-type tricarboxylate transporter receptor subunit TctC
MRIWTLLITAALATAGTARAALADEFYAGRTITILVGNGVGGGYDLYARLLGRHFSQHVPGNPTVVINNMPGGGSFKEANYLYNASPRDGTSIGIILPSVALDPLFGDAKAHFQTLGFQWLGNMSRDVSSCVVGPKSPIRRFDDAFKREITFGATGPAAMTATHAYVLHNMLGAKVKVINGYSGTSAIRLAMTKGEVDGMCGFWLSAALGAQADELKRGELLPIIQLGESKEPAFGNAPSIYDYAKSAEDKQALGLIFGITEVNRPFAAPPKAPAERVATLRKAFMDTMHDPALIADAKKLHLMIDPIDGKATEALFRRFDASPKPIVARAAAAIHR